MYQFRRYMCSPLIEEDALSPATPPATPPTGKSILIGDRSKPCALPLEEGRHADLRNISALTVAELIQGRFNDVVTNFLIVDCRYPYEYEGGHITGAVNLYTPAMIEKFFYSDIEDIPTWGRNIIIFHCEFSQQRGPTLLRHLRQFDRERNLHRFPGLDYPEIYILHGGYDRFFHNFSALCSPQGYIQMNDPRFEEELDKYFVKRKYFTKDRKKRLVGSVTGRTLTF